MKWHDAGRSKPAPEVPVVVLFSKGGKRQWTRACWIPALRVVLAHDEDLVGDYSESDDCYFWPAGWYEWNEFETTRWLLSDDFVVLGWAEVELP